MSSIVVRNNDAIKAYKVLMKKLKKEGLFDELSKRRYAMSKTEKRRFKDKKAIVEFRKTQAKKKLMKQKEEEWKLINAKKQSKKIRKEYNK